MMVDKTSAPIAKMKWSSINWLMIESKVKQLQFRIAKAFREGRHNKAESLQWLLTHSYYAKLLAVRRHVLDNFSEKAIRQDAPMATLEEVLVPMYLLHRYQLEAVAKSIGGLYFTHALKNDGQEPTKMVEPAEQWRAFNAMMSSITPDALALPEALIKKIPPRPTGYPSSVETFGGNTGPTFDPIAVAETAAGTTLGYLLDSERAARLIEYEARDSSQPGLFAVLDKLIDQT